MMMIGLKEIESKLSGVLQVLPGQEDTFRRVVFDSRQAGEGDLFVAVRGTRTDGHRFIAGAVERGVAAVCCEELPPEPAPQITWIVTEDSARALGELASLYYGEPSARFRLTGITGTNGKTSIATSLYHLFRALGYRTGLFATTGILIDGEEHKTTHTTPDPLLLNEQMALMADRGVEYVFMEVSSHAADQERIAGLHFAGGVFTNLSQDHLDYHRDFRSYLYAKKKFFDRLPQEAFALVNADDRNSGVMLQNTKARKVTYGTRTPADYQGKVLEMHFDGTLLLLDGREVWIPFVGEFSASNMTAVYAVSRLLGISGDEVLEKMSALPQVPGRFEVITSPEGVRGIVDYAHTPDAVGKVLKAIRRLCREGEKVLTVLGAGGNRDRSKRPRMARLAYELSDILILTSDNPRDEEPEAIIAEMLEGLTEKEKKEVISNPDRRQAIKTAVRMAKPGDVILVAGKGHETYQEIKGVKHHFDDREELGKMLNVE